MPMHTTARSPRGSPGRNRASAAASGLPPSTLSNTSLVPYSGTSPSSVDSDSVNKPIAITMRWPRSSPQNAMKSWVNVRCRRVRRPRS